MTSHPDAEVLADYREGLLGRRRSARIRAHLAGCARCASLQAGLAEVTSLLASAPPPVMPGHLITRLENALAAEAARARAEGTSVAGQQAGPAIPGSDTAGEVPDPAGPGPRRRQRAQRGPGRPRWQWRTAVLGAAAVLAVLAAVGGAYGLARLVHQGSSGTAASSGVAGPEVLPGTGAHAAAPQGAPAPAQQRQLALPAGRVAVISSGTDYLPGRLAAQADAVLARYPNAPAATAVPAALFGLPRATRLEGCVALVTGGARPSLVDLARYLGRPATIIVQAPAGGRPGQIWVAGPGCSAGDRDLIAHAELPASS